jgi:hypothetical protein
MIKIFAHIYTITHHKTPISAFSTPIDRLQICAPALLPVYIPSGVCCVYPMTKKRVPMHFIIYGIIIGVAFAAVLIIQLGDDQHPTTVSSDNHPGNTAWYEYDHPEESR